MWLRFWQAVALAGVLARSGTFLSVLPLVAEILASWCAGGSFWRVPGISLVFYLRVLRFWPVGALAAPDHLKYILEVIAQPVSSARVVSISGKRRRN